MLKNKRILITGATGFIGSALTKELIKKGCQITALVRNKAKAEKILGKDIVLVNKFLEINSGQFEIIINLAGESIATRWGDKAKNKILNSRINLTKDLVEFIKNLKTPPEVVINASAVGYYFDLGFSGEFDENSIVKPSYKSFSSKLCDLWEKEAKKIDQNKTRLCIVRFGAVLEKNGGSLARMFPAFKLGLGGRISGGKQYFPWIHLEDAIGAIIYLIENSKTHGVFNLVSDNLITNNDFTISLAKALKRPALFPVPAFMLKSIFGQMADEIMLNGQKILPKRIKEAGYVFKYPDIKTALNHIFKKNAKK